MINDNHFQTLTMPSKPLPLLDFDRHAAQNYGGLIGVDEAGRGALAGPVVAAAVWISDDFLKNPPPSPLLEKVNDSKQVSPSVREELLEWILALEAQRSLCYSSALREAKAIDASNILRSTQEAMAECLLTLHKAAAQNDKILSLKEESPPDSLPPAPSFAERFGYIVEEAEGLFVQRAKSPQALKPARILIDGSPLKYIPYPHTTLVRGDSQSFAIALASIVAKVTRDRYMKAAQAAHPHFRFSEHKGYGTNLHRQEILSHGPSPLHRASFLKNLHKTADTPQQTELRLCPPPLN